MSGDMTCSRCDGLGQIIVGCAISKSLTVPCPVCSGMPRRWCSVHNQEEFKYESLEHELRAATADNEGERPRIICLCGSTRFVDTWINEYQRLSDEGNIVLTVARMPPRPNLQYDEPELKKRLDNLHLRKIDLADEVFVLNVGGYIGSSTRSEIAYAESKGKVINYLDAAALRTQEEEGK